MAADDLVEGNEVYLIDGSTAFVTGAELEKLAEPIKVYNLEIQDFHTYFVGDTSILVHNRCGDVQGGGHGKSPTHKNSIDGLIDDMPANGYGIDDVNLDYDTIYGNKALSTAGLSGSQRPDIITVRTENGITIYDIYEFASPSQSNGTSAYRNCAPRRRAGSLTGEKPVRKGLTNHR